MRTEIGAPRLITDAKSSKILDFKLIASDKVIVLFYKHLVVLDTTTKEQLLLYNSIYLG